MGQQQLLLIVLGVIIVGIAVVVGINLFNANAEESTKDGVVSDCTNLGAMAQQYYKKPTSMGGGGNDFTGWVVPGTGVTGGLDSTAYGNYAASGASATQVVITGTPHEYTWTVTTTVTPTEITTVVN
ncbi:MAG: hypothetical protein ACHQLA_05885 [Ignavibacteriales bacterium]